MVKRRDSLTQALSEVESQTLSDASVIVVSRPWWESLSAREQSEFRSRAAKAAIELRLDQAISSHFVEVRGSDEGPPLSTESPL